MVVSLEVALDDDVAAMLARFFERDLDLLGRLEIDGHAATVIAGQRFQDDRESDPLSGTNRIADATHEALFRNRQAEVAENAVRLFLVAGEFDTAMLLVRLVVVAWIRCW